MFCAGRVVDEDLQRTMKACGGAIQSTVHDLDDSTLGTCETFEEKQVGGERFNLFYGCPKSKSCTIILRGGAEQFMEETERSLHDAIMIVRCVILCRPVLFIFNGSISEIRNRNLQSFYKLKLKLIASRKKGIEVGKNIGSWCVSIWPYK